MAPPIAMRPFCMFEDRVFELRPPGASGGVVRVRRKQRVGVTGRHPPVVVVHGATFCSALFDLPLAGYSLLTALADAGRVVYAIDIRGYGASLGPGVMDEPPDCNPPFADAASAVEDIATVVTFVLNQHGARNLDLIGFSWGTITSARFAGENPDKIARLALYAPIYSHTRPIWIGAEKNAPGQKPRLGAYRLISEASIVARWDADLPAGQALRFRDDTIAPMLFDVSAALDPHAGSHNPPAFRCPNGAIKDLMQVFAGQRLFEPAKLTMPVLLVRGEHDLTSIDADARRLLSLIPSPVKHYKVIARGSHFLCIERNREVLYEELIKFLNERWSDQ
jgi:pimeloyl-ACP methyl ester carboxylesterase